MPKTRTQANGKCITIIIESSFFARVLAKSGRSGVACVPGFHDVCGFDRMAGITMLGGQGSYGIEFLRYDIVPGNV